MPRVPFTFNLDAVGGTIYGTFFRSTDTVFTNSVKNQVLSFITDPSSVGIVVPPTTVPYKIRRIFIDPNSVRPNPGKNLQLGIRGTVSVAPLWHFVSRFGNEHTGDTSIQAPPGLDWTTGQVIAPNGMVSENGIVVPTGRTPYLQYLGVGDAITPSGYVEWSL